MTPEARWAASAAILDRIASGEPAEKALTSWARRSRFAGSGDRAAIRDHVFDILRCWRSTAALGGGESGRARVLGRLRQVGEDPEAVFTGTGHAMAPLSDSELAAGERPEGAVAADLPDWIYEMFCNNLGDEAHVIAESLRHRAPVFLRVNLLKSDRDTALARLCADGIEAVPDGLSETALRVSKGARRVAQSAAYREGLVELQDAASQAVVDALPVQAGQSVLDYCAGGGGKALALAARLGARANPPVTAHDADPRRMVDLAARAERAGAEIRRVKTPRDRFDLVLCDVPCSGSGAWRRAPEGKWRLDPERFDALLATQSQILDKAATLVAETGHLAYATCSLLPAENARQIEAFLARNTGWTVTRARQFLPRDGGDGFFVSILNRN